MSDVPVARTFEVRHLQLARAAFAAIAAVMITFSPDHSAPVGLAVFSGFAIATGLVFLLSAWLVFPAGTRTTVVLLGILNLVAGMVGGIVGIRTNELFFALVIAWAALTAVVEIVTGIRGLRRGSQDATARSHARDALTVGVLTALLAFALTLVHPGFVLQYYIAEAAQSFTLTGITIAVGIFGAYAAVVAVYLAIAAFSPRTSAPSERRVSRRGTA